MKRLAHIFTLLLLATFTLSPIANADSRVADCIQLSNPTSRSSSTVITLTFDVYATCSAVQLGKGNGQRPLYEMPQEESLFNLSSCSGPSVAPLIGWGQLGTATCSLRVGSNSLPSPRTGATSTVIRVWFAWDSSEKSISVSHSAIPAGTNNGWGGSSGGSSSGGSSGGVAPAPVVPNCSAAPATPNLRIEWNSTGPKFTYSPEINGEKATSLFWSYSLWNSATNVWEGWLSWAMAPVATGTYQAIVIEGKTKIAFAVQAVNACGASAQAREVNGNTGVALAPLLEDEIINVQPLPLKILTGTAPALSVFAKSSLGLELEATTLAPDVCIVDAVPTVRMLKPGTCKLSVKTTTFQNKIGAKTIEITFEVTNPRSPQVILTYPFPSQYELSLGSTNVYMKTSTGLLAHFEASTDDICFVAGGTLVFKSVGYCNFTASQDGDEANLPAESKYFQFQIIDSRKTLLCLKGKTSKKVLGINPKCPVGYKVKK